MKVSFTDTGMFQLEGALGSLCVSEVEARRVLTELAKHLPQTFDLLMVTRMTMLTRIAEHAVEAAMRAPVRAKAKGTLRWLRPVKKGHSRSTHYTAKRR